LLTQTIDRSDFSIALRLSDSDLEIQCRVAGWKATDYTLFVAIGNAAQFGSTVIPFQREVEGSTVFLPFQADWLVCAKSRANGCHERRWKNWKWTEAALAGDTNLKIDNSAITLSLSRSRFENATKINCAIYAKDMSQNYGWGKFLGCNDAAVEPGIGDKYISRYLEIDLAATDNNIARTRRRLTETRIRIYQLFVRLFGNTNETRKQNGTLAENGVGKFNDITDAALRALREMGFTHVWLTGVLQQATGTDHSEIGAPSDDPDLLKGIAGSPYAIKDYFDVCPDYAVAPARRLDEFKALLDRIHAQNLKALIDFVPNHVARCYDCDVRPELNFGAGDDKSVFFSPQNNFFYLQPDGNGPPLRLPTCKDGQPLSPTCKLLNCDGLFDGELTFGRATGNNVASWTTGLNDWYETVKLNYGFDFTNPGRRECPNANTPDRSVPDTWNKMNAVIEHWQAMGVDGFRCDMSHMVPPEFWKWLIAKSRARDVDVVFVGEAYDNDPMKVPGVDPVISRLRDGRSNVMFDLLDAGFNGVYDDPTYRAIKRIYEGPGWANDIDDAPPDDFIFQNSVRYAENHDEVRLAARSQWGGVGMKVGLPVSAILFGLSRGPIMFYNGQEVGEPADGMEGFGGDDARTSIFDYWSMPEFVKWVNGHKYDGARLSAEQKQLRETYGRLIRLCGERAFRDGTFIPLNPANRDNPNFGRLPNESPSGRWLYSFLRHAPNQTFLVVVNLNPWESLRNVRIIIPSPTAESMKLDSEAKIQLSDRLGSGQTVPIQTNATEATTSGIQIGDLPPLTAFYFEMTIR
jgi:glycosidase